MNKFKYKEPLLTIGMPVYNGEKYLRNTIQCILNQSFKNFKLIISDNASNDNTYKIIKEFSDKDCRIKYIRLKKTIPLLENFGNVLFNSSSEFFIWVCDDDIYDKDFILNLISRASNDTACFGIVRYISEEGKIINSIANNIKFNFVGGKIFKRIKFLYTPHFSGKMILTYSIYPTYEIKKSLKRYMSNKGTEIENNSDDLFLIFESLKSMNYISVNSSVLYKRNHDHSDSHQKKSNKTKKFILFKFFNNIFPLFDLIRYLKLMSIFERIFTILFLPLGVAYHLFFSISIHFKRRLRLK